MKTIILIAMSGFLVAGVVAGAWLIWAAWVWFRKRDEPPKQDPRVRFRTELWGPDSHHIIN